MRPTRGCLLAVMAVAVFCCAAVRADVLDKTILNHTVLITYEIAPHVQPASQRSQSSAGKGTPSAGPQVVSGTGFLLFHDIGFSRGSVYLVTNRHVLPPEGNKQDIQIRVVVRQNDGKARIDEISVPVVGANGKYLPAVRVHPNPSTDVAVIDIGTEAFGSKFQLLIDAITSRRYLDTSMLASAQNLRTANIGIGSRVYILGYPAAIFDPRNASPVLREGLISTDPQEGFDFNQELRRMMAFPEHINGFLVDANVYPGSSGSLVVVVPEGNNAGGRFQPYVVGIVAGSIPMYDSALRAYERIGLGIVYSADTIREVLDAFHH
jgi:hypothetical protein